MKVIVCIGLVVMALGSCSTSQSSRHADAEWPPASGHQCLQYVLDHLPPDGSPQPARLAVRDRDYTTSARTVSAYLCFWSPGGHRALVQFAETGPVRLVGPLRRSIPVTAAGDLLVRLTVRLDGNGTGMLMAREVYPGSHGRSVSVVWQHVLLFEVTAHQVHVREDPPLPAEPTWPSAPHP